MEMNALKELTKSNHLFEESLKPSTLHFQADMSEDITSERNNSTEYLPKFEQIQKPNSLHLLESTKLELDICIDTLQNLIQYPENLKYFKSENGNNNDSKKETPVADISKHTNLSLTGNGCTEGCLDLHNSSVNPEDQSVQITCDVTTLSQEKCCPKILMPQPDLVKAQRQDHLNYSQHTKNHPQGYHVPNGGLKPSENISLERLMNCNGNVQQFNNTTNHKVQNKIRRNKSCDCTQDSNNQTQIKTMEQPQMEDTLIIVGGRGFPYIIKLLSIKLATLSVNFLCSPLEQINLSIANHNIIYHVSKYLIKTLLFILKWSFIF